MKHLNINDMEGTEIIARAIMIGLEEMQKCKPVLKVKRSEDAKQFPLIQVKKHGDVGYDLPAIFPQISDEAMKVMNAVRINVSTPPVDMECINEVWRQTMIAYPGHRVVIPTGISIELPEGYWASIEARSSTSKSLIEVPKGIIDQGYRGELFAVLINVGTEPVIIHHGDRYVQLILHKIYNMDIQEVDELAPSERGDSGFGSTGR